MKTAIHLLIVCFASVIAAKANPATIRPFAEKAYRFFHENPELGKAEYKMATFIREELAATGAFEFHTIDSLPTAVIAVLDTGTDGPVTCLRADMDARTLGGGLSEPADHDPRSKIPGVMHNCGHDFHAAALLGAAKYLAANQQGLTGNIVFLFQPAEEVPGGADDIVADGILQRLKVDRIFGLHVVPRMPVGIFSISPGATMASSNYFDITFTGKGGHAALPSATDDLTVVISKAVLDLSHLPARKLDPLKRPAVISVSQVEAQGGMKNALPATGRIGGTVRCFEQADKPFGDEPSIKDMMARELDRLTLETDVDYTFDFRVGSPPLVNNQELFDQIIPQVRAVFGEQLDTSPYKGFFAEDFAFYTKDIPALYFGVGISKDGRGNVSVHNVNFNLHPDAFEVAIPLYVELARTGSRRP